MTIQPSFLPSRRAVFFVLAAAAASLCLTLQAQAPRPWMNKSLPPERRAALLIQAMTLDEKLTLVHGAAPCGDVWTDPCANPVKEYVGYFPPNARLGIPAITMSDGRAAVENGARDVTLFPVAVQVASSWDTSLMNQFGHALGQEQRIKGTSVMLGPTIDVVRVPEWGRIFETYGEDPYFNAQMAVAEINGIQSEGPLADANMYLMMNQEKNRDGGQNTLVDERTMQEIYIPPFAAAIQQAHVGTFMCAYVKTNGVYSCENPYLLTDVLRTQFHFDGWVMSDWGATHSTIPAFNAGQDQQTPDSAFFGEKLKQAILAGQVTQQTLDTHVLHVLTPIFRAGMFDRPNPTTLTGKWTADARSPQHDALARTLAEQGAILLKNASNTLPLSVAQSIAILGKAGSSAPKVETNTSEGVAPYIVSPLDGIRHRTSAKVTSYDGTDPAAAADLARHADIALVFVETHESEGDDRDNLSLPDNQDALISAVAAANPHTIVLLNTGGAVLMPWVDQVSGIIQAWYPGQEEGNALAKLPLTFPRTASAQPLTTKEQWPGVNGSSTYSEKLNIGYRWFDSTNNTPLFPFGFGLSYTTFQLSHLAADAAKAPTQVTLHLDVTNTGQRPGAEVVQIYVAHPPANGEPPHQLRAFAKVQLQPGQTKPVTLTLDAQSFSTFDESKHQWLVRPGTYQILAGTSSRDLPLQTTITIH